MTETIIVAVISPRGNFGGVVLGKQKKHRTYCISIRAVGGEG